MDTFPVVKRKDEQQHGGYRTKQVILEVYDALAEAARSSKPYQTRLDPPPADARVAHPPRAVVMARTRQHIQRMRVTSYIVFLLRIWDKAVARSALEPGVVLMLNDRARGAILGQRPRPTGKKQGQHLLEYVNGLDGLLAEMAVGGFVAVEESRGQQVFRLGSQAPGTENAPAEDMQRAKETLQALEILGEDRALVELQEIVDETYDLVS